MFIRARFLRRHWAALQHFRARALHRDSRRHPFSHAAGDHQPARRPPGCGGDDCWVRAARAPGRQHHLQGDRVHRDGARGCIRRGPQARSLHEDPPAHDVCDPTGPCDHHLLRRHRCPELDVLERCRNLHARSPRQLCVPIDQRLCDGLGDVGGNFTQETLQSRRHVQPTFVRFPLWRSCSHPLLLPPSPLPVVVLALRQHPRLLRWCRRHPRRVRVQLRRIIPPVLESRDTKVIANIFSPFLE
ncbi:hypothetical protein DFH06DRAFT_495838 [Mycena polygramma]|nr:hypothetical protein DFH06DRAFT_495838 [Mycena polygramma]